MLSPEEYRQIQCQLNEISSKSSKSKAVNNRRKNLQKQLKEHYYATTFDPFEPLPYIPYYVNRTTSTSILYSLIQAAQTSSTFIIDTESINIYKIGNKPALIQLQIVCSINSSLVILVEIYHLPSKNELNFELIQELFAYVFLPGKRIFIWGLYDELIPFTQTGLFNNNQIDRIKYCNLQDAFKSYWKQHHHHQQMPNNENDAVQINQCHCEMCIGHQSSHSWSLQEAIARELQEYLAKTLTNGKFNIGLDAKLGPRHPADDTYAEALANYARLDVLSMHRLIKQMKNNKFRFTFKPTYYIDDNISDISSDQLNDNNNDEETNANQQPSLVIIPEPTQTTQTNDNEQPTLVIQPQPPQTTKTNDKQRQPHFTSTLSAEERRKLHNKSCTIKQRRRNYRYEMIFHNIYYRFSIRTIKSILRSYQIPVAAINTTKTNTLYVGIKPEFRNELQHYIRQTRHFFTRDHYLDIQYNRNKSRNHHRHHRKH